MQLKNHHNFNPGLILVDYLELMNPVRDIQSEHQAQQRITEELRGLAMENDILIWTATQTNRQGRTVKIITDTELADSYGKIRVCDLAISLNQTNEECPSKEELDAARIAAGAAARAAARITARADARDASRAAYRAAAFDIVWNATFDVIWNTAWDAASDAAWGIIWNDALDAASGKVRWTFYTDGPVRFAPAIWKDRSAA